MPSQHLRWRAFLPCITGRQSAVSIHEKCDLWTCPSCKQTRSKSSETILSPEHSITHNGTWMKRASHSQRSPSNGGAELFRLGPMLTRWIHSLATQTGPTVRNSSITTCLSRIAFMQVEGQRNHSVSRCISYAIIWSIWARMLATNSFSCPFRAVPQP